MQKPKSKFSKAQFAKKSLGQNFLNNPFVLDKIVESSGDILNKKVLEIGPGLGALTSRLLKNGADLTCIELDDRVLKKLTLDFGNKPTFQLIHGDILQQDLDQIYPTDLYSIIANIPYNITSPILKKILSNTINKPDFLLLMVQKEVGQKICNPKKRSILSISVEVFAEANYEFTVTRENFTPIPRVDSAIIKITTRATPLVSATLEKDFFTVVNAGFSQKRKKLGNFLGKFFGFESAKILGNVDPERRAETLNIDEWIEITHNFQKLNQV